MNRISKFVFGLMGFALLSYMFLPSCPPPPRLTGICVCFAIRFIRFCLHSWIEFYEETDIPITKHILKTKEMQSTTYVHKHTEGERERDRHENPFVEIGSWRNPRQITHRMIILWLAFFIKSMLYGPWPYSDWNLMRIIRPFSISYYFICNSQL